MNLFTQINQLDQMHFHIEHKSTGCPDQFASRLNISRSSLYRILAELKDREVPIVYSRTRGCFMHTSEQEIPDLIKRLTNKMLK